MRLKIEEVLDKLLTKIEQGRSVEDCLREYPEFSQELEPILRLSVKIKGLPKPEPSPEVMSAFFWEVEKVIAEQRAPSFRFRLQRVLALAPVRVVSLILLVIFVGWTTLSFSARSMPGHILYPVKRFAEKVQHTLTVDQKSNAFLHLTFADRRANELLWAFERQKRIHPGLLSAMLGEVELAIHCSDSLPKEECSELLGKIQRVNQGHKSILERIKVSACGCDTTLIQKAINQCLERNCCIEEKLNPKSGIKQSPCPCLKE